MYAIAITVLACLRAGTDVAVAWAVADPEEAVAFTPGGGKVGGVLGGALDARLAEIAHRVGPGPGRLVELEIGPVDALISGLPADASVRAVVTPAALLPDELWSALVDRRPVTLVVETTDGAVTSSRVAPVDRAGPTGDETGAVESGHERVVTTLHPEPRLILAGSGAYADGIAELAAWLGWSVEVVADPVTAAALAGTLAPADVAVVVGHDHETTGAVLLAALASRAGYVAALGSPRVRRQRAAWLAARGVTDLTRLHMPAGLDLGAERPREVALSVLAEALAASRGSTGRTLTETGSEFSET